MARKTMRWDEEVMSLKDAFLFYVLLRGIIGVITAHNFIRSSTSLISNSLLFSCVCCDTALLCSRLKKESKLQLLLFFFNSTGYFLCFVFLANHLSYKRGNLQDFCFDNCCCCCCCYHYCENNAEYADLN